MIKVILTPIYQTKKINALSRFSETGALSRLLSAAIVDEEFRNRLLTEPLSVIADGYNGESFFLGNQVLEAMVTIKAKNLADFVSKLLMDLDETQHPAPIKNSSRMTTEWDILEETNEEVKKKL